MTPYEEFSSRLKLLISKNPHLIITTLSNIFSMRLIGNKTHGDLAEIAIAEFINQYMYDYKAIHVGKDLYRAKQHEEDIKIINEMTNEEFPVSLKAYGDGPLQLSTDKKFSMFPALEKIGRKIMGEDELATIWEHDAFVEAYSLNVLPLIYDEKRQRCNILIFDYARAQRSVVKIEHEDEGRGRKHPVYRFYDCDGEYVCEVRYGSGTANALQRGLWTNTKSGLKYFESVTGGWVNYSHNPLLVNLFSNALLSTSEGHKAALDRLKEDIEKQKSSSKLGH